MFLFDTDHFTLYVRGQMEIARRVDDLGLAGLTISVVTVEEVLAGWYAVLRQAKTVKAEIRAYAGLFQGLQGIKNLELLPFSPDAIYRFHELRKQHRRLGRMDLAIAAIALEFDVTLLTRNRVDFEQIPGLKLEDWSQSAD